MIPSNESPKRRCSPLDFFVCTNEETDTQIFILNDEGRNAEALKGKGSISSEETETFLPCGNVSKN